MPLLARLGISTERRSLRTLRKIIPSHTQGHFEVVNLATWLRHSGPSITTRNSLGKVDDQTRRVAERFRAILEGREQQAGTVREP